METKTGLWIRYSDRVKELVSRLDIAMHGKPSSSEPTVEKVLADALKYFEEKRSE